jgi:hypothetical protein
MSKAMALIAGEIGSGNECWDIIGGDSLGAGVDLTWTYQTCTELPMPIASGNTPPQIFDSEPFSWEGFEYTCNQTYGTDLRTAWEAVNYGMYSSDIAKQLKYASNIVFSNGEIDPWSVGGIKTDLGNPNLTTIQIADSAHHLDMRAPTNQDPASVVAARKMYIQKIEKWTAKS